MNSERPRRVLIVEDDEDSRMMLGELVAAFGHHPFRAACGDEAIEHAPSKPDVALIDIGLPGEDGCEVAKRLRAALGNTPIRLVALTGYSDGQTRENAGAAGFDDYMIKPVLPEALQALLKSTPVTAL